MVKRWILGGLILLALTTTLHAKEGTDRRTLLSVLNGIPDLKASASPSEYDPSNIEQFDPALAPALKLYGTAGITTQKWATANESVTVTLFEMLDSAAAYGLYTLQRSALGGESTPTLFGAASFHQQNQLYFWQANYAVRIEGARNIQHRLAQQLSRSILGFSQKPPVSEYLPSLNIIPGTERYLLSPDSIDPAAGVESDKLGFDSSAEVATAAYRVERTQARLLLVLYPTQHIARKHMAELESAARIPAMFRKRAGPLLAIVYGTRDEAIAASILDGVSHEFKVTWNEPQPGLGVSAMLITILTFIGLALALTTFIGVSYGGLRVFLRRHYPHRILDRPETAELIQLKLNHVVTDRSLGSSNPGNRA
jgi:hypothetical protein